MLRAAAGLLVVAGSVALGAAAAVTLRADLLVGYGVGKALEARKVVLPFEVAAQAGRPEKAEVGDEVYWLTRSAIEPQAPFDQRLAVGDRITIAGQDGRARSLQVVDIRPLGAPVVRIAADAAPLRLVRVTARVVGATGGEGDEIVRFYIELEERKPPILPGSKDGLGRT